MKVVITTEEEIAFRRVGFTKEEEMAFNKEVGGKKELDV